jgi:hypothetical protein
MQQVGGALGLAVLVTVFGSASKSAAADLPPGLSRAEAARHVFVSAADKAFWTAAVFLLGTLLLVTFAMRRDRAAAGAEVAPAMAVAE